MSDLVPSPGRRHTSSELEHLARAADKVAAEHMEAGQEEAALRMVQVATELRQKAWLQRQAARRAAEDHP